MKSALVLLLLLGAHPVSAQETGEDIARKLWSAGVDYVLADDKYKAHISWTKCLEHDPKSKDCLVGLQLLGPRVNPDVTSPAKVNSPEAQARRKWNEGLVHFQQLEDDKARKDWEECVQLDAHNNDCKTGLQRIDRMKDEKKDKRRWKTKKKATAVGKGKKREAIEHWNKGILHFQQSEFKEARKDWLRCLARDPANEDCKTGIKRLNLKTEK